MEIKELLLLCKIHGILPELVRLDPPPYVSQLNFPNNQDWSEYQCWKCEEEKRRVIHQPKIDEWNRKQK